MLVDYRDDNDNTISLTGGSAERALSTANSNNSVTVLVVFVYNPRHHVSVADRLQDIMEGLVTTRESSMNMTGPKDDANLVDLGMQSIVPALSFHHIKL